MGERGEDYTRLERNAINGLEGRGDQIMESAESSGYRNYACEAAHQHYEQRIYGIKAEISW